jgi:hypothetical protein
MSDPAITSIHAPSAAQSGRSAPLELGDRARALDLSDGAVRVLLAFALIAELLVWWRVRGYSLADSVEFMERARIFVRGETAYDEGLIRPFGFSSVLLPFFVVADWLGMQDVRPLAWAICVLQIVLGLALVLSVAQVGARIAGRRAGLVAGFFAATNPIFLQYSAQPISDIAAAVFIARGLAAALEPGGFRRGLASGLWFGAALLMAYKSLLIALVVLALVALRDRWKKKELATGIAVGLTAGIGVQALLDRLMFGRFGVGFVNYVVSNVLSQLVAVALMLKWKWAAVPLYRLRQEAMGNSYDVAEDLSIRAKQSPFFYVQHLPQMIVWPLIGLAAIALLQALVRPRWNRWLLIGGFVGSAAVMSAKGSKDFRLWIPLLPFIAPLCAAGWSAWFETRARRGDAIRGALSAAIFAAVLGFNAKALAEIPLRQFGGFWSAIACVNARAADTYAERAATARRFVSADPIPPRLRVACGYNWSVYMRESPLVELDKLPWQLNFWAKYDDAKKAADLEALEREDAFIVHMPMLTENPELFEWIDAHFEVFAAYFDPNTFDVTLGPILVLVRRTGSRDALTFFDVHPVQSIEEFRKARDLPPPIDYIDAQSPQHERLLFLGYQYRALPGDHYGWITYYWCTPTGLSHDYHFIDRITSADEANPWQNNHEPAYGVHPTSTWRAGEILSEGYPLVPSSNPFKPGERYRPLGGPYRRGELIPVRLWMAVIAYDPQKLAEGKFEIAGQLDIARPGSDVALRIERKQATVEIAPEIEFSNDGLPRVGAFFLPVHPAARVPNDGRPIPP